MQQKQTFLRPQFFIAGFVLVIIAGIITLMVVDIPAPKTPVEKILDAKSFIAPKS